MIYFTLFNDCQLFLYKSDFSLKEKLYLIDYFIYILSAILKDEIPILFNHYNKNNINDSCDFFPNN